MVAETLVLGYGGMRMVASFGLRGCRDLRLGSYVWLGDCFYFMSRPFS